MFGYLSGFVSIVSDGFHSCSEATSNGMGCFGLRAARKPPDANHPYGHRKFETIATAGIFIFLLLAVVEVAQSALGRLRSGTSESHIVKDRVMARFPQITDAIIHIEPPLASTEDKPWSGRRSRLF